MFEVNNILVFSNSNFNYIKEKRYRDTKGNVDIHTFNGVVAFYKKSNPAFEDAKDVKRMDYLHLATNMFESKAIIMDDYGTITTRAF